MNKPLAVKKHWKLGVHLIFKTKRFGVNNGFWSAFPSPYGRSFPELIKATLLIYPLCQNYRAMRWRMGETVAFIPAEEYEKRKSFGIR